MGSLKTFSYLDPMPDNHNQLTASDLGVTVPPKTHSSQPEPDKFLFERVIVGLDLSGVIQIAQAKSSFTATRTAFFPFSRTNLNLPSESVSVACTTPSNLSEKYKR